MPPRVALVSTQRRVRATLASFLRWHLDRAGFDAVFLYFDSPAEDADAIAIARDPHWAERVIVVLADEEHRLREGYAALPSWADVGPSVGAGTRTPQCR